MIKITSPVAYLRNTGVHNRIGFGKAKACGCVHVPVVVWEAPKFEFNPGVAGVSLVTIGPWFVKELFFDSSHLNQYGYEDHSDYLKDGLHARCWW